MLTESCPRPPPDSQGPLLKYVVIVCATDDLCSEELQAKLRIVREAIKDAEDKRCACLNTFSAVFVLILVVCVDLFGTSFDLLVWVSFYSFPVECGAQVGSGQVRQGGQEG